MKPPPISRRAPDYVEYRKIMSEALAAVAFLQVLCKYIF